MKRGFDIIVALLGLLLVSPVVIVVAFLIKLDSRGPVFFRQERIGRGFRPFFIYKFRTMSSAPGTQEQVWAGENDSRITPIGGFLRKTRLDELPQLVNVLLGDMNIVGPRPEQPEIFSRLKGEVESYRLRQQVMPGITGWAQINHSYDTCLEDVKTKVMYDLEYIDRISAGHDLGIMLRTLPVMVGKKGAR